MSERNVESTQLRGSPAGPDLAAGVVGLGIAVAASALGGVAVALAPVIGVVSADAGAVGGPSAVAAAYVAVVTVGTPLFALLLLRGGRVLGAAGVLGGWALAGIGAAAFDAQLFTRAIDANRFELFRPLSAATLHAGPGAYVLLAGHLLIVAAGVLAAWAVQRAALLDDPDGLDFALPAAGTVEARGSSLAAKAGRPVAILAALSAVVTAAALFATPLRSDDPVVLVNAAVASPRLLLLGTGLLAAAVLSVLAVALVSRNAAAGGGAVAGVALGVLGVSGPRLIAGAVLDRLGVGAGSAIAVAASVVLLGCAAVLARAHGGGDRSTEQPVADVRLPGPRRMQVLTAALGLAAGGVAVAAGLLPALAVPGGLPEPQVYSARVLLLAGVVLAALSAVLLAELWAATVRPAVAVAWLGVVLGASGVFQAVLVANSVPGVGAGIGTWTAVAAVLLAGGCGLCAGLAGAVERDEIDTSQAAAVDRPVFAAGAVAVIAAIIGLGLPLYRSADSAAAALFTTSWGWDSWGLLVVTVGVVAAVGVAARSRPARALALLGGAAVVLAVHLLSWPLTGARIPDSSLGAGVVGSAVAMLAMGAMAALIVRGESR